MVRKKIVRRAGIVSVGKYMPPNVVTNFDLEKIVDTSDEWIRERTGIIERHMVKNGEKQSDLALIASREALARAGWSPKDLDMIIVGTVTPDHIFPSSANLLAGKLGAIGAPSYDVLAACSGFLYSLWQGVVAIESGRADRVLVVGSEIMSTLINWEDRSTCVLFGDGAGVVLLKAVDAPYGIHDMEIGSDGRFYDLLHMKAGGSAYPATHETVEKRMHTLYMEGSEVFKLAVRKMTEISESLLERNRIRPEQLGCFIAHQANIRIIDSTTKRLRLKPNQVYNNIDKYGNTTSATIPTCLYEAEEQGMIKKGDWVLLISFGAGLTWGGILMKWAVDRLPKTEEVAVDTVSDVLSTKLRPGGDWANQ
ncbi:MAG TPA: ketoacyl-ACP synthase III [Firmicutes bacterium]|nr:ketoacyl-ACP synthase III [Bacillota bacterium]